MILAPRGWPGRAAPTLQFGATMCHLNLSKNWKQTKQFTSANDGRPWLVGVPARPYWQGANYSLSACVTNRFRAACYSRIQLHTEYHRLPAIKTYLKLEYVPVMYCRKVYELWEDACRKLDWPYTSGEWPNEVVGSNHGQR